MYLCHCSRCRKETGSVHGTNLFFNKSQLIWESGEDNVTSFSLENTRKKRNFCKTCGCALARQEGSSVIVPAGSLDEPSALNPTAHIYYDSRASWEDKLNTAPYFPELPSEN